MVLLFSGSCSTFEISPYHVTSLTMAVHVHGSGHASISFVYLYLANYPENTAANFAFFKEFNGTDSKTSGYNQLFVFL